MFPSTTILFLSLFWTTTLSAKILVVQPLLAWSHYMQFEVLFETLATRGHDVTVYSPFPPKHNVTNFKHVPMNNKFFHKRIMDEFNPLEKYKTQPWFFKELMIMVECAYNIYQDILVDPTFKKLITSREKYDLVMVEPFFVQEITTVLGHIFNCPVIGILCAEFQSTVLNTMDSPNFVSFMPELYSYLSSKMNFWERIQNLHYYVLRLVAQIYNRRQIDGLIETHLGPGLPPIDSMLRNISLVLAYTHPVAQYPFPRVPNIVDVGGIHLESKTLKAPLPEDLKKMLDDAKDGFVLFSLGSVITPKTLPPNLRQSYFEAFRRIKLTILWKWSGDPMPDLPRNVIQRKWIPQKQTLDHPNCKLFITHGGLSSSLEAFHAGVPLVTLPSFNDQFRSAIKAKDFGVGEYLESSNVTADSLEWAVKTVLGDPRYKENVITRSRIMRDQFASPLETATYWVEHVIRHKGATYLSSPSKHLSWYEFYLFDVIAFLVTIASVALTLLVWTIQGLLQAGKSKNKQKKKKKNKKD